MKTGTSTATTARTSRIRPRPRRPAAHCPQPGTTAERSAAPAGEGLRAPCPPRAGGDAGEAQEALLAGGRRRAHDVHEIPEAASHDARR